MTTSEDFDVHDASILTLVPDSVRALLIATFEPRSFEFGAVIVREGERSDEVHILVSGRARAVRVADDGEELTLETFGPGATLGERAVVAEGSATETIRTNSQVRTLSLDGRVYRALLAGYPELREQVELGLRRRGVRELLVVRAPFGRLSTECVEILLDELEPIGAEAGEIVVREGEPAGPVWIVEGGQLLAHREEDGHRRDLAYYRTGDVFTGGAPSTGGHNVVSVEAVGASRLLRVGPTTLRGLLDRDPSLGDRTETWVVDPADRRRARVPVDFAAPTSSVDDDHLEDVGSAPVDEARSPEVVLAEEAFVTADGRFRKAPGRIRRFPLIWGVDEADCGPACLAMVCRHHGRTPSPARVRRAVGTGLDGTSLAGLTKGAQELGLASRGIKASRRNLDELPLPAIVHWEGNHWIVLYDVDRRHVRVADPESGLQHLSRQDFDERWTGYAVLCEPSDTFADLPDAPSARSWLLPLFRPFRGTAAVAALLALVVAALQMVIPIFIQIVVDDVLPARDYSLLRTLLLSMAAVVVVMSAASVTQRYLLSRAAVDIDGTTLDFLTGRLLALPLRFFYARRTGDLQRRLMGMRLVREFAVQQGVIALTAAAQVLAVVVLMFVYSPTLTVLFLASVPLYVLLMRYVMRRLRPLFDSLEQAFGDYSSRQIDAIKGIDTVKALGAEPALRQQLAQEFARLANRIFRADFTSMAFEGAVQVMTFVSLGVFLWAGSLQVLDDQLTVGELVSFNALVVLAHVAIVQLLFLWDQLQLNTVLVNRLSDVFEEEPEQGADHSHLRSVPSLGGRIRLEHVGFRYGGSDSAAVLDDVTCEIRPGTTVAIVGRSGSGKTTLVKCLAGLLEPSDGKIFYDTVDLTELDHRELRQRVGIVLQENYLFSDTIAANIAFGAESEPGRVRWAARVADADKFIDRLPFGYDTRVGETGLLLSGGQRQRIAIARALYRRPPILILDEATSSLDTEAERAVRANLELLTGERTTIVIAHRLSTVKGADEIWVLDEGRLVERGTHQELMALRGLYFHLTGQQLDL